MSDDNSKLDSSLLLAFATAAPKATRLFEVVVGFVAAGDSSVTSITRDAGLSKIGPRTAAGNLTREQCYRVAQQPAVRYLKLTETLREASSASLKTSV